MPESNCPNCGSPMDPNGQFCPSCGQQVSAPAVSTTAQYQAPPPPPPPQYQPPRPVYQAPQPVYQAAPQNTNMAPVLGMGSYIGMMILSGIPLVGFILLLVWAFSSNENPNKKNYARAVLLLSVIISVLITIIYVIVLALGLSMYNGGNFTTYP